MPLGKDTWSEGSFLPGESVRYDPAWIESMKKRINQTEKEYRGLLEGEYDEFIPDPELRKEFAEEARQGIGNMKKVLEIYQNSPERRPEIVHFDKGTTVTTPANEPKTKTLTGKFVNPFAEKSTTTTWPISETKTTTQRKNFKVRQAPKKVQLDPEFLKRLKEAEQGIDPHPDLEFERINEEHFRKGMQELKETKPDLAKEFDKLFKDFREKPITAPVSKKPSLLKTATGLGKGLGAGIVKGLAQGPAYEFLNPPSAGPAEGTPEYDFEMGYINQDEFKKRLKAEGRL